MKLKEKISLGVFKTKLAVSQKMNKLMLAGLTVFGLDKMMMLQSFATNDDSDANSDANTKVIEGIDSKETMTQKLQSVPDLIFTVSRTLGAVILAWGIVQFALAMRNDDADSKMRSALTVFAGILLLSAKAIANVFGLQF